MDNKLEVAKKIFYASGLLAVTGGIISLLYYAYLMPLHVDEAGWWFHYTNKSYQYRFIFNRLNPNHTLTVYLAKISLWMFGNTGIGLRLPVIVFGTLSAGMLYLFAKKVTGSRVTGILASAILFLNPFFLHYSHELRGYPAYFFFLVCCYLCFIRLLEKGNRFSTWTLLFLLFMACYVANLAAPMFFSVFLASVWIFVILRRVTPIGDRVPELKNIHIGSLFAYSAIATSFFAFIMFYVDRAIMPNLFAVQISEPNYLAIPDLFSAFLGYHYLDDATSVLYSYPTIIWLISLSSFLYGWWIFMRNRSWYASVFLLMFILNSLFYISMQTWIPLRSSIYLLPFILLFQAYGLKALVEMAIARLSPTAYRDCYVYLTLAGILVCYFALFSFGKYRNFEPDSGNPYELTRAYLKDNTGPNDLIISSLYDTIGGFYLGDMIREKNSNIYKNGRIENVYYLAPKTGESKIELDMVYPERKKNGILPLDKFEPVVSYENNGVRPSKVHIFKRKVELKPIIHLNQQNLSMTNYFGNFGKSCKAQIAGQGIKMECDSSPISCANQVLTFSEVAKSDLQFVLFHHINNKGTKTVSHASMKSMDVSLLNEKNKNSDPIPDTYILNQLVNNIYDLDVHRKEVDLIDISLQKMGSGKSVLFCMRGKLFEDNSLIEGAKVFNWK
jgi:hypothetical protein